MRFILLAVLSWSIGGSSACGEDKLRESLAAAQAARDESAVKKFCQEIMASLGKEAGVAEEETLFTKPGEEAKLLEPGEVEGAFMPVLERLATQPGWWKTAKSAAEMEGALRQPASVLVGCLAAMEAGCARRDALEAEARAAADFLCRAQSEGAHGCFPFPAWHGKKGKLGSMADAFLARAEKAGKLAQVEVAGWIVDDLGGGDLQFDNGLCGCALLRAARVLQDPKFLAAARLAGDWAMQQPTAPNFNYNSFSVELLAQLHAETKEPAYLTAAKEKARLGIYPGQLTEGPHQGRWVDPHNARLVYHFIIVRGLLALLAVLPPDDADRAPLSQCLTLALESRNKEIMELGAANPDTTVEVFISLADSKGPLQKIAAETHCAEAAEVTFLHAVDEFRRGHATLSPGTWGLYLLHLSKK